jgi:hypothetical protein
MPTSLLFRFGCLAGGKENCRATLPKQPHAPRPAAHIDLKNSEAAKELAPVLCGLGFLAMD